MDHEEIVETWPKPVRRPDLSHRRWRVDFKNLAYDGGGSSSFSEYYRTKTGARFGTWMHLHVRSWGGGAVLVKQW